MKLRLEPVRLKGRADVPLSKSQLHRMLLLGALGNEPMLIRGLIPPFCRDTLAMLSVVCCLGTQTLQTGEGLRLIPGGVPGEFCDVGECAAALRLSIPVFASRGMAVTVHASPVLFGRCTDGLEAFAQENGLTVKICPEAETVSVRGTLPKGKIVHACRGTSQLLSGLLIALAGTGETLEVKGDIPSRPYVDLTLEAIREAGCHPAEVHPGVFVLPKEPIGLPEVSPEADASSAAVLQCMNALGAGIRWDGPETSLQGDTVFAGFCREQGPLSVNCDACPDIAPLLALLCTQRSGESRLTGLQRLRLKECDRYTVTAGLLNSLGAEVVCVNGDSWKIIGKTALRGGVALETRGDHRMAMLLAAAAGVCEKPIVISGTECVAKSWPGFWDTYRQLGGIAIWQADSDES